MAQRRMFSPDIVDSDAFLDMPTGSQLLYFHLAMRADDDGFVSPKKIMRMIGSPDDELKVLVAKRFVLEFDSGVLVIKHWLIHNLIRADLYKETTYTEEKKTLGLSDNGSYTELRPGVSELAKIEAPEWLKKRRGELRTANVPSTARRLGKDRLGKDSKESKSSTPVVVENDSLGKKVGEVIYLLKNVNPTYKLLFNRPPQRKAAERLIEQFGMEKIQAAILYLEHCLTNGDKFCPTITTPIQLESKWGALQAHFMKNRSGSEKGGVYEI